MFNQEKFNKFLIENNVVGFKEEDIVLKSGRVSRWYANCRRLTDDAKITNQLVDFVIDFIEGKDFDYVYGVPAGVTKLGVAINLKLDGKLVIGREKPKEHGDAKDKYFIGPIEKGDKVIVIEDVTTTGGSLIDSLEKLKEVGVEIVCAVGLVNRVEKREDGLTVKQKLNEIGIDYFSMGNAFDLLPLEFLRNKPSEETKKHVEDYFRKYSIKEVEL